jgi:WD40 repeat protein
MVLRLERSVLQFSAHNGEVLCIGAVADSSAVFTGGIDFQVKVWSAEGELLSASGQHHGAVNDILVVEGGEGDDVASVWTGSADGSIHVSDRAAAGWTLADDAQALK